MKDNSITIVMPIHNQQDIIGRVLEGIIQNASSNVKEICLILDGCTDGTEHEVDKKLAALFDRGMKIKIFYAPNVYEVISCNIGFKNSECAYSLNIQDDMIMTEKDFDIRMLKPFDVVSDLIGVTARNAQDEHIVNGKIEYFNVAGRDVNSARDHLYIRDVIVRAPILWDNRKLAEMNYLDQDFAPLDSDDKDLCWRSYKTKGYLVGAYTVDYISELAWGGTRKNAQSYNVWLQSAEKNLQLLMERHADIMMAKKHDEDIYIP